MLRGDCLLRRGGRAALQGQLALALAIALPAQLVRLRVDARKMAHFVVVLGLHPRQLLAEEAAQRAKEPLGRAHGTLQHGGVTARDEAPKESEGAVDTALTAASKASASPDCVSALVSTYAFAPILRTIARASV